MARSGALFAQRLVQQAVGLFRGRIDVGAAVGSNWQGEGSCLFEVDVPYSAAQLNTGSVPLIEASAVPRGMRLYVTDWAIRFGGTAFATANDVRISTLAGPGDSAAITDFVTVAVANTNQFQTRGSGTSPSTGVTQGPAFRDGTGGTVNQGLQIRLANSAGATVTGTAGSNGSVYVRGYFAP